MSKRIVGCVAIIALSACGAADDARHDVESEVASDGRLEGVQVVALLPVEQLGKALYFDPSLSKNRNQSCATCHDAAVGYTGGSSSAASTINAGGAVYPGSDPQLFGNRKPPSAAYAGETPSLAYRGAAQGWVGGVFWDGRATGWVLGDPLAEQAKGPFLNPLEMALSSAEELRQRVRAASYAPLFDQVFGVGALDAVAEQVYDRVGIAVAAYERSAEVNSFSSRFDQFWDRAKAKRLDVTRITTANWSQFKNLGLDTTELYGLAAFNDSSRANCASCHSLQPGARGYPLFTNYEFHNLGLPKNPRNPFYANLAYNPDGAAWVDTGLGGFLDQVEPASAASAHGRMRVPTLRNVDKRPSASFVRAYGHNGYFKSLVDIVRFYRCRAMGGMHGGGGMGGGGMGGGGMGGGGMGGMCGMGLPAPEVNENLAALGMFPGRDESYLVAFLKTLSDSR